MLFTRFSFALIALICLTGWIWLRKPYSPTQELPAVVYTAYNVEVPDTIAGIALARAARGWQGVTASTYNPGSSLLVLSHTTNISAQALLARIQILSPNPVSIKVFPEPVGPKCPVPQAALAALPNWLLGMGLGFGLLFVWLFLKHKKPTVLLSINH